MRQRYLTSLHFGGAGNGQKRRSLKTSFSKLPHLWAAGLKDSWFYCLKVYNPRYECKLSSFCSVLFFYFPDDCRKIEFADRLENKALINHVIISFREIEEEMCEIKCYLEPNCRSYNYGLLTNGTFLCELSDTQHVQALPDELEARNGFNYRSIEQVRLYIKI